jgi:phage terminase small subunit
MAFLLSIFGKVKLTTKQQLFCDYYVGEARFNGTKAARLAGYSEKTAKAIASENLTKPDVRAYIDDRLQELTLGANEVLARLTDIANGSIEDVLDEDGRFDFEAAKINGKLPLVKKLKRKTTAKKVDSRSDEGESETLETSVIYEEVEFEMYSSHEALRDLGKFHKLFTDRHEVEGSIGTYPMSKEEWEKAALAKLKSVDKQITKHGE